MCERLWYRRARGEIWQFPIIPSDSHDSILAILSTPDYLMDAAWAAWSWHRFTSLHFELRIFVDGDVPPLSRMRIERLFPGVRVENARPYVSAISRSCSALESFRRNHPLGTKLLLVLALQLEKSVLFTDADVLAFSNPKEILEAFQKDVPAFVQEEGRGLFDDDIISRLENLGMATAETLNSGLLAVPKGSLVKAQASQILTGWNWFSRSWFTEQTIMSALMEAARAKGLPRDRYVISNRRQFYWETDVDYSMIAARHFTGPVRHVMYSRGFRRLREAANSMRGRAPRA
jgi:hypothetical protein